jgi:peptidyl-prolyl cis-trans isomerase B (cyclophilin B)
MKKATIETAKGTIALELFSQDAPGTVANFEKLANSGYYDGVTFHRVIPGFMIQGGDPRSKELPHGHPMIGSGGPGYTIPCEVANNPRRHGRGALSMAKTAAPNTGGSQFFITHVPTPHLDGLHTVFGQVLQGQDVVDAIEGGDVMMSVKVEDVEA